MLLLQGLEPEDAWPEDHKRSSEGDRRSKPVQPANTVGTLIDAAPHPCATILQRNDAVQERLESLRGTVAGEIK